MNKPTFEQLSTKYAILEKIGFEEFQIKIWIMSHMDIQDKIDVQGFGKFSCKSFMNKGKSYQDLIEQVNELVRREVLFVVDKSASIIEYRFTGEAQYEFQKLLLATGVEFKRKEPYQLVDLFRDCLKEEQESSFINANMDEFFAETRKDSKKTKDFLSKYLVENASSYALFILSMLR